MVTRTGTLYVAFGHAILPQVEGAVIYAGTPPGASNPKERGRMDMAALFENSVIHDQHGDTITIAVWDEDARNYKLVHRVGVLNLNGLQDTTTLSLTATPLPTKTQQPNPTATKIEIETKKPIPTLIPSHGRQYDEDSTRPLETAITIESGTYSVSGTCQIFNDYFRRSEQYDKGNSIYPNFNMTKQRIESFDNGPVWLFIRCPKYKPNYYPAEGFFTIDDRPTRDIDTGCESVMIGYYETGAGVRKCYSAIIPKEFVLITSAYINNGEMPGVYRAIKGPQTTTFTVQDAAVYVLNESQAKDEFYRWLQLGKRHGWAQEHIYPLPEWVK
jgi:hypothetical protein